MAETTQRLNAGVGAASRHRPRAGESAAMRVEAEAPPHLRLHWVLLAYPLLWSAAYLFSTSYWFLPTGVRLAALMRVPVRHWPWLWLIEVATIAAIEYSHEIGYRTWAGAALGIPLPWLVYATLVFGWQRLSRAEVPTSPRRLLGFLSVGFLASLLVALLLTVVGHVEQRLDPLTVVADGFGYLIGDYVGVLCVTPILLQIGSDKAIWRAPEVWVDVALSVVPLAVLLLLLGLWAPDATIYGALFAMVPPLWLAYRQGWRGAALAIAGSSAVLYFGSSGLVAPELEPLLQMLLALVGSAALLLGAWSGLELQLRERLQAGNAELAEANRRLSLQSEELRALGARLMQAQDDERRRIRADLRGELSQQIGAMSSQLAMLVRQLDRPELLAMVDTLRTQVQAIHDAADECIERLQPNALLRRPLAESLGAGGLRNTLEAAGIHYSLRIDGREALLGASDRMNLYRVVQHLVSAAQHCADALSLDVAVNLPMQAGSDWIEVQASLAFRSPRVPGALEGEADIRALRDRMLAADGKVDIAQAGSHGAVVTVHFARACAPDELRN